VSQPTSPGIRAESHLHRRSRIAMTGSQTAKFGGSLKARIAGKLMSGLRRLIAGNRALCRISELRFPSFFGFPSYQDELRRRVDASLEECSGDVLEIGGIDRPFLSKDDQYRYVGLDIEEKPRCDDVYDRFVVQSVEDPINRRLAPTAGRFGAGGRRLATANGH
jgi:hypothetical protein